MEFWLEVTAASVGVAYSEPLMASPTIGVVHNCHIKWKEDRRRYVHLNVSSAPFRAVAEKSPVITQNMWLDGVWVTQYSTSIPRPNMHIVKGVL